MEKKSIGQFIAVLRKASGMTQMQLAERLNVSDKAVSRWERDESLVQQLNREWGTRRLLTNTGRKRGYRQSRRCGAGGLGQ